MGKTKWTQIKNIQIQKIKYSNKRCYSTYRYCDNGNKIKIKINIYLVPIHLFEGDGHIWLPSVRLKKNITRVLYNFNLKDEPLAKKLLEIVGYGFIRYKPQIMLVF